MSNTGLSSKNEPLQRLVLTQVPANLELHKKSPQCHLVPRQRSNIREWQPENSSPFQAPSARFRGTRWPDRQAMQPVSRTVTIGCGRQGPVHIPVVKLYLSLLPIFFASPKCHLTSPRKHRATMLSSLSSTEWILLILGALGIGVSKSGFPGLSMFHVVLYAFVFGA